MLFNKKIEPSCGYCLHGKDLGGEEIACVKRGIMASYGSCREFSYEPTKRKPHLMQKLSFAQVSEEDFVL